MGSLGLYRSTFVRSIVLFGAIAGSVAAVCFQFIYVPITSDVGLTIAFFWGVFFLLFEVPIGAIVGVVIALVVTGCNAVLPAKTKSENRTLAAGLVSAVTFTGMISAAELLVPGESSFTLSLYMPVVIAVGIVFGLFTRGYFRRFD